MENKLYHAKHDHQGTTLICPLCGKPMEKDKWHSPDGKFPPFYSCYNCRKQFGVLLRVTNDIDPSIPADPSERKYSGTSGVSKEQCEELDKFFKDMETIN